MQRCGRSFDHRMQEAIRLMAIELMREGAWPSAVIASYGVCRTTIYKWLWAAEAPGGARAAVAACSRPSAQPDAAAGPPGVPLGEQGDSRQPGLDFGRWTRVAVAELIEQKFDIVLGQTAVRGAARPARP